MTKLMPLMRLMVSALLLLGRSCLADSDFVWSAPKDGVKIGVAHFTYEPGYLVNGTVQICIERSTNYMTNVVIPKERNRAFELFLRGTNGQLVSKTRLGLTYGAQLPTTMPHFLRKRGELSVMRDGVMRQLAFFNIDECFLIKEYGEYELEIRPRLLKEIGGDAIAPIIFDPIKMKLHLQANVPDR